MASQLNLAADSRCWALMGRLACLEPLLVLPGGPRCARPVPPALLACLAVPWLLAAGCATTPVPPGTVPVSPPLAFENPVLVPVANHELVYETMVDVVDDYFRIEREVPVRLIGNIITEGSIRTFPETGSTLLEPWRRDSANSYEKLLATLQTIRRYAVVRVFPDPGGSGGFRAEVNVFKELEDVIRPESPTFTPNEPTFHFDTSMTRVVTPVGEQPIERGWIALGRDPALEQQMIAELLTRVGSIPAR